MTEPTTPTGRALLEWDDDGPPSDEWLREQVAAIENDARAEGRREAVREIREHVADADTIEPSDGPATIRINDLATILDDVARPGRSSDPTEDGCECHGGTEVASCEHCVEIWARCSSDPTEETICNECGKAMDDTEIRILDKNCLHRLRRSSDPKPAPDSVRVALDAAKAVADMPPTNRGFIERWQHLRAALPAAREAVPALQATPNPDIDIIEAAFDDEDRAALQATGAPPHE